MRRVPLAVALVALVFPSIAFADDPFQLGAFLGPRIFSQQSALGYIDGEEAHPMLENSVAFGARIAHRFELPWLYPEFELAFSSTTTTTPLMAAPANIFWIDPRVQLRFELLPGRRVQPFIIAGAGSPIALSSARATLNSGVIAEGFAGGGVRLDTQKGFTMRFDARIAIVPGENPPLIGVEAEIGIGIEFHLGEHRKQVVETTTDQGQPDRDGDGIPDATDKCPDRPEDKDGFEDADGCPDIDNDGDHILDIADKCPNTPETYNGFEDEDGCPDTVPPDVDGIKGTIEGLLYADGETAVRDSAKPALKKIVKVMTDHPSIKVVLIGHTDNQEAKEFAPPAVEGQPPPGHRLARDPARPRPRRSGPPRARRARHRDRTDRRRRRRCRRTCRRQRHRQGPARELWRVPDQARSRQWSDEGDPRQRSATRRRPGPSGSPSSTCWRIRTPLCSVRGRHDAIAPSRPCVQGFAGRVARRLNRALHRTGKLFATRFHARALKTPREVRNALRYVLLNRKHHASRRRFDKAWIDPCSSAAWFDGWAGPIRGNAALGA